MSRPTTTDAVDEQLEPLNTLRLVARTIRDINAATHPIHAIRATLRGFCYLDDIRSAALELSSNTDDEPIVISLEHSAGSFADDQVFTRVSYPLDLDHPGWRTASVVVMQVGERVGHFDHLTASLASFLAMLNSALNRHGDFLSMMLQQADLRSIALADGLWRVHSIEALRQTVANWLGGHLTIDFAMVRTIPLPASNRSQSEAGAAFWPYGAEEASNPLAQHDDARFAQPEASQSILVADRIIEGCASVRVIAGRDSGSNEFQEDEQALFNAAVSNLVQHMRRITSTQSQVNQVSFLSDVQELTIATSAADDLDEICALVHIAASRFVPVGGVCIDLDLVGTGPERIYASGMSSHESPETSSNSESIRSGLVSGGQEIGSITIWSDEATFHPEHSEILEAIARSSAGAFERQLLLNQIERQSRFETGLRLIAERINGTLDTTELMNIASDVIFGTVQCNLVVVSIIEKQTRRVRHRSLRSSDPDFTPPVVGYQLSEPSLTVDAVQQDRQLAMVGEERLTYPTFSSPYWSDFQSAVATPFPINRELSGVIVLCRNEAEEFKENELSLQRQIATMLSTALENSFAYTRQLRHTRDLEELQALASRIASQLDLQQSIDEIVASAAKLVEADGCAIGMIDGDELVVVGTVGSVVGNVPHQLRLTNAFATTVLKDKAYLAVNDFEHSPPGLEASFANITYARALLAVRLPDPEGKPAGVISVFSSEPRVWSDRDISLLTTLASASAIAIQNARHFEGTRDLLRASVESLATAVEAKDPSSQHHARRVARYARMIADELGLSTDTAGEIELAALLHDVGKIGIPDTVLEKHGPLDAAEWAAVQLHPSIGEQILAGNPALESLLPLVRHHHERWDGNGYPDRLKEHHIPVGAAIIAVAEAVDSITTERRYQSARSWGAAVDEIRSGRAQQFAPFAADAFLRLYDRGSFSADELRSNSTETSDKLTEWNAQRAPALDVRALRILEAVAAEIREGADLETFLTNILRFLREILDMPFLTIFTRSDATGQMELTAAVPEAPLREDLFDDINAGKGLISWVARYGVIQNVPDVTLDNRYVVGIPEPAIRSELCVPLVADGKIIGVLNIESDREDAFTEADERLLTSTGDHIANAIHVMQLHERLRILSSTDALTGLDNHRSFFDQLVYESRKAMLDGTQLSVVIMDVNNLKAINDSYGHLVGDAALRGVADVLSKRRRPQDTICRYGGDEFALIMPRTSSSEAISVMETLVLELMDHEFEAEGVTMPLPTSSWGVATAPEDGHRPIELLARADERMYQQKSGGRD